MHPLSPVDAYIAHRKRIINKFEVHKNCNGATKIAPTAATRFTHD